MNSPMPNANTLIDPDAIWFPVRCTAVGAGPSYQFIECWLLPDGTLADRIGGRLNTASDPAYAIDGSTFTVAAAGTPVKALARRGPGAAGTRWELKGFSSSGRITCGGQIPQNGLETAEHVAGYFSVVSPSFSPGSVYFSDLAANTSVWPFDNKTGWIIYTASGYLLNPTAGTVYVGLAFKQGEAAPPIGSFLFGTQIFTPVAGQTALPFCVSAMFETTPVQLPIAVAAGVRGASIVVSTFTATW